MYYFLNSWNYRSLYRFNAEFWVLAFPFGSADRAIVIVYGAFSVARPWRLERVQLVYLMNVARTVGSRRPLDQANQPESQICLNWQLQHCIHCCHLLLLSWKDAQFYSPLEGRRLSGPGWLVTDRLDRPSAVFIRCCSVVCYGQVANNGSVSAASWSNATGHC